MVCDTFGPWFGTTDRHAWFKLWNANGGDITNINGIKRGHFRLHPDGPMHESDGCITVLHRADFDRLQRYIRAYEPDMPVPGIRMKAYGRVEVR